MHKTTSVEEQVIQHIFHIFPVFRNRILKSKEIIQETEVQLPHAQILMCLSEHENMSVTQLSKHTGIAMPNITPIIDKLCALEYVNRHHSKNDRRMVEISILPKGLECIKRIKSSIAHHTFHLDSSFTESQLNRLNNALTTIVELFPYEN